MNILRSRRRPLACQEVVELVTDYLEGSMSGAQRRRFEGHLSGCPHCTEYLRQMRMTIALTGAVTPEDLSLEAQSELTAVFRDWLLELD